MAHWRAAELASQSGRKVATGDREVKRSAEFHPSSHLFDASPRPSDGVNQTMTFS